MKLITSNLRDFNTSNKEKFKAKKILRLVRNLIEEQQDLLVFDSVDKARDFTEQVILPFISGYIASCE